ncbi:MAG: hypothetical protein HQK70_01720 [Desulfamplus sp.]|nr:hypothetical protein [Desulfamplus sp.]
MTHHKNHDHSHSHSDHHHHDEHKQSHDHHSESAMSLGQKFSLLLKNWIDHNNSHKESYISWAEKAESDKSEGQNLSEAAILLRKTAELSERITENLESALKSIRH